MTGAKTSRQPSALATLSGSMHNFMLEAWVGAGLLGAIFFCLGLAINLKRLVHIVSASQKTSSPQETEVNEVASMALAVFVYLLTHGLVESGIAGVNNFFSVPLLYCIVVGPGPLVRLGWQTSSVMN